MNYGVTTNLQPPQLTPNTRGAFNNAMAQAQADSDHRFQMKEWDRNGVSRGRGTQAMAGIKAANALSEGIAKAYQVPQQDAVTDAGNTLQFQQMQEGLGLGTSAVAQQAEYANALAALQRQQNAMQFTGNVLGGLMGAAGGAMGSGRGGSNWLDSFLGY
jgi:hypothetical protein